jgi:hypothetical protein
MNTDGRKAGAAPIGEVEEGASSSVFIRGSFSTKSFRVILPT